MPNTDSAGSAIVDLSIVIVNWNTCKELRACLRSLDGTNGVKSEVIVIDNASSDDSVSMVRDEFPWVKLIAHDANSGFAKGSNLGIAASSGRYVLLLNPDCEARPGAMDALVRFGDVHTDAGIFGLKVLNSDGSIQHSCRHAPTLGAVIFRNPVLGRLFPDNPYTREYLLTSWNHDTVIEIDWVSGAALVMRRELIDDIGVLDERFYMYCEDMDLGYRAKQNGWKVLYFPDAVVTHAKGRSSDKDPNRMIIEHHKSMYRYYMKHGARRSYIVMRALVPAGLALRAGLLVAANVYRHMEWIVKHRGKQSAGGSDRGDTNG